MPGVSVLFVDDEPLLARPLGRYLQHEGFDLTWADSPKRALELAHSRSWSVIVCDLDLGDLHMDGLDVVREVGTLLPTVVTIVVTGQIPETVDTGATRVDALIVKPVQLPDLVRVMRELLGTPALLPSGENCMLPREPCGSESPSSMPPTASGSR